MDLLDELAALSLCEEMMGSGGSSGPRLGSPFPTASPGASMPPPRPSSIHSIWSGGVTPPRTPDVPADAEPLRPQPLQPQARQPQQKLARVKGGRQHQLSPTQSRRMQGERSPPSEGVRGGFHGEPMALQPALPPGQGQPRQPTLVQLQGQNQQNFSGLSTGLPLATMMTINGVPQLVAVLPQQFAMANGMSGGAGGIGQQPGILSQQQLQQQLHALAQQHSLGYPYHNSAVMPRWSDGAMGGPPPMQHAPPQAPPGWPGGDGRGGDRGKKHEGGEEARHASKRLMYRGREIRSVDEASEAGALRELAHEQHGCRFLQDQLDLRHKPHIDLIFEATKADAVELAMDPFGNYLVQKLVQYGTTAQRGELVDIAGTRMPEVRGLHL